MSDNVTFSRDYATPPNNTVVRTENIAGQHYQVVIPAQADGTEADATNPLPILAYGKTGDTTFQVPRIDVITHNLILVDHAHHEVHEGHYFRSGMNFTLANGAVATLGFVTPNTAVWAHVNWFLETSSDGIFTVLEDVTSFSGGASITSLNHDRNSANTSVMTLTRGATGADLITPTGGTTMLNAILSTGKGSDVSAGHGEEFILKQNSKYLFRYTNGTSANVIRFVLEWYEHTSKEA